MYHKNVTLPSITQIKKPSRNTKKHLSNKNHIRYSSFSWLVLFRLLSFPLSGSRSIVSTNIAASHIIGSFIFWFIKFHGCAWWALELFIGFRACHAWFRDTALFYGWGCEGGALDALASLNWCTTVDLSTSDLSSCADLSKISSNLSTSRTIWSWLISTNLWATLPTVGWSTYLRTSLNITSTSS